MNETRKTKDKKDWAMLFNLNKLLPDAFKERFGKNVDQGGAPSAAAFGEPLGHFLENTDNLSEREFVKLCLAMREFVLSGRIPLLDEPLLGWHIARAINATEGKKLNKRTAPKSIEKRQFKELSPERLQKKWNNRLKYMESRMFLKEYNVGTMSRETYALMLTDPRWQALRGFLFRNRTNRCERCGSYEGLQIHHRWYENGVLPWEYPLDCYEVLCRECHRKEHGITENQETTAI